MPLSPSQSQRFVLAFVVAILALSVLATVLIVRGWGNDDLQEQVSEQESERRSQMPRLSD